MSKILNLLKCLWPYLLAIGVFIGVSCLYMAPQLDGKVLTPSDDLQASAMSGEVDHYYKQTGQFTWWTGSMFCGMPSYQIGGGHYDSETVSGYLRNALFGWRNFTPLPIVLLYCLCFFVLIHSFKVNKWLAIVGALATAFSSYFFIIIGAGHMTKTLTLAMMGAAIGGFYLILNGHRLWGVAIALIFMTFGMYPHPQMTYYFCMIIGALWVGALAKAVMAKAWRDFAVNTLLCVLVAGVAWGTGTARTFANLEYTQETMRGGHSDLDKASDAGNKTEGLDLDYATAWSYGIDECWTFLIPDYMGGSSSYNVGKDSELCQTMVKRGVPRRSAEQFCQNVPTYWGDQPFTAGPVYMGAIVCLLFVLGLIVVKGPTKWALLAVTLLCVCLSWGYHWMDLTRLFFEHVPMYNKFRAVSSILVVAEITMPVLGFMALQRLVDAKQSGEDLTALGKKVLVAAGIVAVLLLVALATTSGFMSAHDDRIFSQLPDWLNDAIVAQREAMFKGDLWRSMGFVLVGAAVVWFYAKSPKFQTWMLALVLGVLVLADMWPVNKRYMNDDMFRKPAALTDHFAMQPYEQQIEQWEGDLADPTKSYRVFNLTGSPFNDARTSYRLKSLGGYHAAKLRRYQDLIDQHLGKMHWPVINMLNARYIIVPTQEGNGAQVQPNAEAMGNAWYVSDFHVAETPNEECDALTQVDLHTTAVVGRDYADKMPAEVLVADSMATVTLTHYTPPCIDYVSESSQAGTIVFSEIFYPHGWKASIDGQPAEHYRVNYALRALNVPAGRHEIRFEFRPDSVEKGDSLSMFFVAAMYLILLTCVVLGLRPLWRKNKKTAE